MQIEMQIAFTTDVRDFAFSHSLGRLPSVILMILATLE